MLSLNTLKTQISSANDSDRLRLNKNQQTEIISGNFFGRQVARLSSGTLTVSRSAENQAVKDAVIQALRGHYGKAIADTTNPLTNSDKPLTAQTVKQWIQAADDAVMRTLSQKLTTPPHSADSKYENKNFSLKQEMIAHLSEKYSDEAVNQAIKVVDMSPGKTWTALDIQRLNDTAQALHLQPQKPATTSNHASAYFGDTNQVGQSKYLGSGNNNAVSLGKWAQISEISDKVFKPLSSPDAGDLQEHGIVKKGDGNMLGRNVASSELAHALGMPNKITASYVGQQNGVQGIVMEKAQGSSIRTESLRINLPPSTPSLNQSQINALNLELSKQNLEIASIDGKTIHVQILNADGIKKANHAVILTQLSQHNAGEPANKHIGLTASGEIQAGPDADQDMVKVLQSQLTKGLTFSALPLDPNGNITNAKLNLEFNQMQWLDFLCGQADRNPGNIFIQYDANGSITGITGIDQDLSFGEKVDAQFEGGQFQGMPKQIDGDTANRIKELYKKYGAQFAQMLADNGLNPQEISQAKERLKFAYGAIRQWETQSASTTNQGILPATSTHWSQINTEGYSKYFASSATQLQIKTNPTELQKLFNPGFLSLKADIQMQKHIGQSLENICTECKTPEGVALAQSAIEQLTQQERATTLSQASATQISTLASLPNAHPDAVAELQRRHQIDTQRFHATVQRLQAEDLNLPTSLTNAPAFARTMVQLAETWASLQAYAAHPNAPITPQTQTEHQFLQGYLQTQTQRDTLAADDLSEDQLGRLNQALRILTPRAQRATALQGFSAVFDKEFNSRLTQETQKTQSTWKTLLSSAPTDQTIHTLKTLSQQHEKVIAMASAMLMDGARNHAVVQSILQDALQTELSVLASKNAVALASSWLSKNSIDSLLHQIPNLQLSEEASAMLEHCIASMPDWIQASFTAWQKTTPLTPTVLPQQAQQLFDQILTQPLSAKELSAVTSVAVKDRFGNSTQIQIPDSFIKDAERAFAQVRIQGQEIFDFTDWAGISSTQKSQRVEAGIQKMLSLCGDNALAVQKACHFLQQSALAPLTNTIALTDPAILTTSSGLPVKSFQESKRTATFDLTPTATGFAVQCNAQFNLTGISTKAGVAPIALNSQGNTVNFNYGFVISTTANRVIQTTSAPQITGQLHLQNVADYPMPTTSTVAAKSANTIGQPLSLFSPLLLQSGGLISDMHQLAQHTQSPTISALASVLNAFSSNASTRTLIAAHNELIEQPEIQKYLAQQVMTPQQGQALLDAFKPILQDSRANLSSAFTAVTGQLAQQQWSFGSGAGLTFTSFIAAQPNANDWAIFRAWAESPRGAPESMAFMDAFSPFSAGPPASYPTIQEALGLLDAFVIHSESEPTPLGAHELNMDQQKYDKSAKDVCLAARQFLDPYFDAEILPALYAMKQ